MLQHEWPPIAVPAKPQVFVLMAVFFGFALIHSFFAAGWTKNFIGTIIGRRALAGLYRLGYTVLSVVITAAAAHVILSLPDRKLLVIRPLAVGVMILIETAGAIFGALAFRKIDFLEFIGVRQAVSYISGRTVEVPGDEAFISKGVYSVVRHPLYLAGITVFTFFPFFTMNRIIVSAVADIYFLWGAWIEDKRMLDQFGEQYRNYMRSVPAIVPRCGR
ncbi:MAG: hypothetical protein M0018_03840 [Nitrospiraceae bacterium]|nr:hypothetical protein [Nitrospiraceae bacterium]